MTLLSLDSVKSYIQHNSSKTWDRITNHDVLNSGCRSSLGPKSDALRTLMLKADLYEWGVPIAAVIALVGLCLVVAMGLHAAEGNLSKGASVGLLTGSGAAVLLGAGVATYLSRKYTAFLDAKCEDEPPPPKTGDWDYIYKTNVKHRL